MKNIYHIKTTVGLVTAMLLLFNSSAYSQNGVRIAATTGTADPSAMLDVVSTAKGVLIPRMTAGQRVSISLPATGLLVYQTDGTPGFYYNAGTPGTPNWIILSAGALSGVGVANQVARWTTSSTLGAGVLADNGTSVGVGTTGPVSKLTVVNTINHSYPTPGQVFGTLNIAPNPGASPDQSASLTFSATQSVSGAQAGIYVQSSGSYGTKMYFGTTNSYATGSQVAMMIDHNGRIGMGTLSPTEKLDLNGKLKFTPNGSTMSHAPRVLHTTDPRGGCPGGYSPGTDMFSHTFTVNNTASVYLSGQIIRHMSGRADLYLMLNGGQVDQSLSFTSSAQWDDMNVQWSGVIGPGTYTVSLRGSIANVWGCGSSWGSIDSIIFEH